VRGEENMGELTIEQTEELYKFLQGEAPDGYNIENPVKLTSEQAFGVIWFLQERYRIIPDRYEQCNKCKEIFDSYSEGIYAKDGSACECCRSEYNYCPLCDEYFKKSETPETTYFVLSLDDAKDQDMQPGLYKAKNFPIYSSNMFSQWIYKDAVEVEKETNEYEETGFICQECFNKLTEDDRTSCAREAVSKQHTTAQG